RFKEILFFPASFQMKAPVAQGISTFIFYRNQFKFSPVLCVHWHDFPPKNYLILVSICLASDFKKVNFLGRDFFKNYINRPPFDAEYNHRIRLPSIEKHKMQLIYPLDKSSQMGRRRFWLVGLQRSASFGGIARSTRPSADHKNG